MTDRSPLGGEQVDGQLVNLMAVVALAVDDAVRAATEDVAGFGAVAPAALVALAEFADGASIERLRDVLGLTHSGCVRLVDRLAGAGLVARAAGTDRRSVAVNLTRTGREVTRRIRRARANAVEALLADLSPEGRQRLRDVTAELAGAITRSRLAARTGGADSNQPWMCRLCDFTACGRNTGGCPVANTAATIIGP